MPQPQDYTITAVKDGGLVDNPKAPGQLQRQYVTAKGPDGTETSDVYLRRKPENAAQVGSVVFGELQQNDQGWRLFPKQRDGAGNFQRPAYKVEGDPQAERSRRIERQHSQEMAIRWIALLAEDEVEAPDKAVLRTWTNYFAQDLDADVGSSQVAHGASDNHPSVDGDAADLSAETSGATSPADESPRAGSGVRRDGPSGDADPSRAPEEASPQQKGKLTQMFHAAGLSRDAMKAVVMWRCGQEKATKQGASQLITDLQEGATHDALLAEIWDAKRAGNPLGARAAALIAGMAEVPADTEGLPEWKDDGSLPEAPAKDEEGVPF